MMSEEKAKYVTCLKCSWISFAVSLDYVEDEVKRMNEYLDSLSPEKFQEYYGGKRPEPHDYVCLRCSGDKFRPSTEAELKKVFGCTINSVLWEGGADET